MRSGFPHALLGILLLTCTIFGAQVSYAKTEEKMKYTDSVEYVLEKNIIPGRSSEKFDSEKIVSRAEFFEVVMKMFFSEEELDDCLNEYYEKNYWYVRFPDVSTEDWLAPYVCVAVEEKLVSGFPDGNFHPNSPIQFAAAAKIFTEVFSLNTDQDFGRDWFEPFVESLVYQNAVPENIEHVFSPVTEGNLAEMIFRLAENITDRPSKTYEELAPPEPQPCSNCLIIPKLGITVPIVFGVGEEAFESQDWERFDTELMKGLENGIVHDPGTVMPGETGNSLVSGHSSYYRNLPGNYKEVFAHLEKLEAGDIFEVYTDSGSFSYTVFEKLTVFPADQSAFFQPVDEKWMTLVTCWPRYTTTKRLLVRAILEE